MSTTIDQRVVEMRFDNKHFENNVQTSLSTLDKLKQKLHLTGASKGLENLGASAKKVDMSPIANGVEAVRVRFSALDVMATTALANITNQAVNAGKRMVSALTIDPIKTGFSEYETQMNAVQTILANTQSKGSTLDDVNNALGLLNEYADQTIYNFTEMTRNIGTFTAAGVDLQTSVDSIKGIANLAAVSGSSSQQASTAMYQLSQALAAGKVSLMDWNSVVNAGMGGQLFQDALVRTSELLKTGAKDAINTYGSFRESLTKGEWLTTEVLTETLKQLSGAYTEADLIAQGFTEEQAKEITKLAETASNAATKVKTFTQLWDVLKESAQSGWAKTWQLIVGDFEEAKALLSPLADFLTGIINKMSDWRNDILEKALGSPFGKIAEKIKDMSKAGTKAIETIKNIDEIATKVIRGDFGNGQERRDKLTEAYGSWEAIQNRVNEMMGDSYRHTVKAAEGQEQLTESQATSVEQMLKMSDAQLKKIGLNEEEIESLRNLKEISEKTGISIQKIMDDPDSVSGRNLLINSFKNLGKVLIDSLSGVKQAWQEIFPPKGIEERAKQLYNLIAGLHKFTSSIADTVMVDGKLTKTGENLVRTFKGLFAVLDIISTLVMGPLKIGFKIFTSILSAFDLNILDVTAAIGDAIVGFRDWIDSVLDFGKLAKKIPGDIISGLAKGIREKAPEVFNAIVEMAKSLLNKFCEVLGIHSPSREFEKAGGNIIDGLINGIQNGASKVWEVIKGLGKKCVEVFKSIDFGKLFAAGLGISMVVIGKKLVDVLGMFASPLDGLGGMFEDIGDGMKSMLKGIGSAFKANALEKRSVAIRNFAIAIGILAASVAVLSQIDAGSLWKAVAVIGALAVILGVLAIAVSKFAGSTDFGVSFALKSSGLVGLVTSILIFVGAIKLLSSVDVDNIDATLKIMAGIVVGLGILAVSIGKLANGETAKYMGRVGKMFTKMAVALLIMVGVIKLIGMLKENEIKKGLIVIGVLEMFMLGLVAVGKLAGKNISKVGGMMLKISVALLIMVGVIKLAAQLDAWEIEKGIGAITILELLFMGIIGVSKLAGQYGAKAGSMLLMMSGAILILIGAIKLIAGMDEKDLTMGLGVIATLEILFMAVIAVSKLAGENAMKAGAMLIMMSTALAILTGVIFILSKIDPQGLVRGLGAVAALEILFMGLIAVTHLATDCMGPLIVMTVAIGVLAAAVIAMSFIDPSKLAGATIAMSMLVGVFAILVAASKNIGGALPVALMMGLVLLELVGIFALLKLFDIQPSIESASALSILLLGLSAACVILSRVGYLAKAAVMGAVGLAGVIAVIAVVLTALGGLSRIPGFNELIKDGGQTLALIGYAIGNFVGSIVGGLAAGITSGLPAIGANLSAFMVNVAPFIAGVKMVDGSVLTGVGCLAGAILALTAANVVQGIASWIPNVGSFAELGTELSNFMINAMPFIHGAKLLNEEMLGGVKALAETILILTQANLLDGLASLFGQESGLTTFASQLPELGTAISSFATNLGGFSEEQLVTVKCAAMAIKTLASAAAEIPNTGGLLADIVGDNDLGTFASQFPILGMGLKTFLTNVGTFSEDQVATVKCAADAIKVLAEASSAIPNTGGLLGDLVGDNDLGTFAAQFPVLATGLKGFLTNIGTFTEEQVTTVKCASNAVKALAEASSKIPNMGGWLAAIIGDNSLGTFASQFPELGSGLRGFLDNVGTFTEAEVATIGCAANAVKVLAAASQNIDGQAEWAKKLFGDNGLSALGDEMADLGTGLSGFVTNLGVFTADQVTTVNCAVSAIKSFASLAGTDLKSAQQNLPEFGAALPDFGTNLGTFCTNMPSTDSVTAATSNISEILSAVDGIANRDPDVIVEFTQALNDAGTQGVNKFIDAFTDAKALSNVKTAAKDMMSKAIEGVESKINNLKTAFKDAAKAGAEAVKEKYQSFYDAGSYLVDGFAAGISENDYKAEAKARAMAKAAAQAAEDALDINSPSKVFRAIGYSVPEGFAMGIDRMSQLVSGSAEGMADTALNSTKDSISRIADIINSDIDAQPTIRPVLDLSNVRSGAGAINGLLGSNTSIGLLTNVGTVSSMMNSRSQNGANSEVVSAINKLRSELGNMSGNTYNVNGITYDDGSNIATAVKEIARAALRERRT